MDKTFTDIELWTAFKSGEEAAFERLFNQFYGLLFHYGSKICPNKQILEDCIQDLFLELWHRKSQNPVVSVKVYLLKALKYKIFKALSRNNNDQKNNSNSHELAFEFSHENFIVTLEESQEQHDKLLQCLQQLSNRQREVIYLKIYKNFSYEEIGELMQINYQATRNLLYQAIKSLRVNFNSLPVH